jgi:hypothetical protein
MERRVVEVSPRMNPLVAADALIERHGSQIALRMAVKEKANARRARSRRRFQLWAAIKAEIETSVACVINAPVSE